MVQQCHLLASTHSLSSDTDEMDEQGRVLVLRREEIDAAELRLELSSASCNSNSSFAKRSLRSEVHLTGSAQARTRGVALDGI